jgi:antagonist of KipI
MIHVLSAGPQTTVQDLGRFGQLRLCIPPSGAMDRVAFLIANRLVGNADGAAALECTLIGPTFTVDAPCGIAVTGADMPVRVNGVRSPGWTTLRLARGDEVRIGSARAGVRSYVAVSGGVDVPAVLGSRATYLRGRLGGLDGRALRNGDRLAVFPASLPRLRRLSPCAVPQYPAEATLRVVLGPQRERFADAGIAAFLGGAYAMLPSSDRMGARLRGERIAHMSGHDIVSDGIALGAVQVPGDGQPIILLLDRQSTGGYTKIATVCSFDIPRVAQLRPGQTVRFHAVGVEQAHRLLHESDLALQRLTLEEIA